MRVGEFGPKRKTQVELLRYATPQDGREFQEPGSHSATSPVDGAMQGQGEIDGDEVYRADRPAGDTLGLRCGSGYKPRYSWVQHPKPLRSIRLRRPGIIA